jgi:aminoglycoside/choline kinase family phosphotransferase
VRKQVAGDASPRRYFRVTPRPVESRASSPQGESFNAPSSEPIVSSLASGQRSWIAVTSPSTENNAAFLDVQRLLDQAGLVVPAQYASDLDQGFFLMEDFGDVLLASQLAHDTVDRHYLSALRELRHIVQIPVETVTLPRFNAARIAEELSVFPEWFLCAHLGLEAEMMASELWEDLLTLMTQVFLGQPQSVVHRDFHSRNIMCLPNDRLGFIDFQDAVVGPITYDPVSLLKDCYVQWPRTEQLRWLEAHRQALRDAGVEVPSEHVFIRDFDLVGLQRHLRVLGVFARLCLRDAKPDYLNDLPLVLAYTREALGSYQDEPAIGAFSTWFESAVMPRIAEQSWYQSHHGDEA